MIKINYLHRVFHFQMADPLFQKYWNSEANAFISAVDWSNLGSSLQDEYSTIDQHLSFYFQLFTSGSDPQFRSTFSLNPPTFLLSKINVTDNPKLD